MRRVLKIGGSLLSDASLPGRLDTYAASLPPAETFAIVGGGELIDAMRGLDARFCCNASRIHWRCVDLLRTTFEILGDQLPAWRKITTREQFVASRDNPAGVPQLVSVDTFYFSGCGAPLPENWSTTTDAIAGWLAMILGADELVLLKSCKVDSNQTLIEMSRDGIIDEALPTLAQRLCPLRFEDFRRPIDP